MPLNNLLARGLELDRAIDPCPPIVTPDSLLVDVALRSQVCISDSKLPLLTPLQDPSCTNKARASCVLFMEGWHLGIFIEREVVLLTGADVEMRLMGSLGHRQECKISAVVASRVIPLTPPAPQDIFTALSLLGNPYNNGHCPIWVASSVRQCSKPRDGAWLLIPANNDEQGRSQGLLLTADTG